MNKKNSIFSSSNSKNTRSSKKRSLSNIVPSSEREKKGQSDFPSDNSNRLFSEALSKAGSNMLPQNLDNLSKQDKKRLNQFSENKDKSHQLKEAKKKAKKERIRQRLHEKINPVDQVELFNQQKKNIQKEIEKLKEQLKGLSKDLEQTNKDVVLTLETETVAVGRQGKYYINFFHKLRQLIILLRKKIKSARTWLNLSKRRAKMKKARKKRRGLRGRGKGIDAMGANRKEAVQQAYLNPERSLSRNKN